MQSSRRSEAADAVDARLLERLAAGPASAAALVATLGLSQDAVHNGLHRLTARGLVRRVRAAHPVAGGGRQRRMWVYELGASAGPPP